MSEPNSPGDGEGAQAEGDRAAVQRAIEVSIRLGAIALLVGWCLMIIAPFVGIVIWALIIAIAAGDGFEKLCGWLGGRRALAATLLVVGTLLVIFTPTIMLSETLVSGAQRYAHQLSSGEIAIPTADPRVRDLPVVGKQLFALWERAHLNLSEVAESLAPQLRTLSAWLLKAAGSVGAGLLQLIGSVLIAGVMLVRSDSRRIALTRFANRMAGEERGPELVLLADATVRSVVQGIVGVAAIQGLLAGCGFAVAGIPGAGLWAMLVLVAAVVQLPATIVMLPPIAIGFSTLGTGAAMALLVWCLAVGLVDNVLKPLLFGRGVEVPALVIFLGALGGMLTMGVVGLFLGAVVLALGFELFKAWLGDVPDAISEAAP